MFAPAQARSPGRDGGLFFPEMRVDTEPDSWLLSTRLVPGTLSGPLLAAGGRGSYRCLGLHSLTPDVPPLNSAPWLWASHSDVGVGVPLSKDPSSPFGAPVSCFLLRTPPPLH